MGRRLVVLAVVLLVGAAPAAAQVAPYQADDFKGFHDVLPPGTNGLVNPPQLAAFLAFGARPEHNDDQLAMYGDLVYATPGLKEADIPKYFKDASFGVKPDDVASTVSPRGDVTIVRDRSFGVPHVYGTTRAGAMYGLGYIAAQDRLFFIDVLRHVGRGELSSFVGGAPGNRDFEAEQWSTAPYTEADLQRQIDQFDDLYGAEGAVIQQDFANYAQGINDYIAQARADPSKMPGEYAALNRPEGPEDWKQTDIIATASLVGGIFGKGGGNELRAANFLQSLTKRFGKKTGRTVWRELMAYEDPDAPTTVKRAKKGSKARTTFDYQRPPKRLAKGAEVLPDAGSVKPHQLIVSGPDAKKPEAARRAAAARAPGILGPARPTAMSNALMVSARKSETGRPLAVFGPQTGYFAPQILMEQDVHAPGIDARGAAFAGVNLYVQLGRGRDYSWSATSAGQDIIDTYAVPLCEPGGAAPTLSSAHYRFRGQCLPIEVLEKTNSWQPNAADSTPAGSQTMRAERTKLGLVKARGTVKGRPTIFTALRSTYFHEVDSALGFAALNDPARMRGTDDFKQAVQKIGYTFNWLYVDDRDTAYYNSGNNPVRAKGTTGQLPMDPRHEWRDYDPTSGLARYTPPSQHPQVVNQDYTTNWNNKQAPGYAAGDGNLFSAAHRSQMLDQELDARLAGGQKIGFTELIDAMEEAGTTDFRGEKVLPLMLDVLGSPADPALAAAAKTLRTWAGGGAHRRDKDRNGAYDEAEAVRIMDAWWPRYLKAAFEPTLGPEAYAAVPFRQDNEPNNGGGHLGSAYEAGWYGYVVKDLKRVLGRKVRRRYARGFCGAGRRARCRTVLEATLKEALAVPADKLYPAEPGTCPKAGDQWCFDAVKFRPLGVATQPLIHWINRPTYQQAVSIEGHRPR